SSGIDVATQYDSAGRGADALNLFGISNGQRRNPARFKHARTGIEARRTGAVVAVDFSECSAGVQFAVADEQGRDPGIPAARGIHGYAREQSRGLADTRQIVACTAADVGENSADVQLTAIGSQ